MKLLEKESLQLQWREDIVPYYVNYAFIEEKTYKGKKSHQEAVLEFLNFTNRIWKCDIWAIKHRNNTHEVITVNMLEQQFFSSLDETIIYSDQSSLINNGYPTLVNKEMMESTEISPKQFFMDGGIYEQAFFDNSQETELSKLDFEALNQLFFPLKDKLIIYSWNTDFTNYYNFAREGHGAYLWSIYDSERNKFTVISIALVIQG